MNQYNLTMEQITAYRTWLSGEEKSAGTIEKYLRDIGAFARWRHASAQCHRQHQGTELIHHLHYQIPPC